MLFKFSIGISKFPTVKPPNQHTRKDTRTVGRISGSQPDRAPLPPPHQLFANFRRKDSFFEQVGFRPSLSSSPHHHPLPRCLQFPELPQGSALYLNQRPEAEPRQFPNLRKLAPSTLNLSQRPSLLSVPC